MLTLYVAIATGIIILLALLVATIADRVSWFKNHPVKQSFLLGILSLVAASFAADYHNFHVCVGFMDLPVILSGLFFGPIACIITMAISITVKAAVSLFGVASIIWGRGCIATLLVALYTMVVAQISFRQKRPSVLAAFVAAAFGESVHIAFLFASGLNDPGATFEIVYITIVPMTVSGGLSAALYAWICPRPDGSSKFREVNTIAFMVFFIAFAGIVGVGCYTARRNLEQELRNSAKSFKQSLGEYIAFSMHRCSRSMSTKIRNYRTISREELAALADDHALDEVNIISLKGQILASSSKEVMQYLGQCKSFRSDLQFRQRVVQDDPRAVVKQCYRDSLEAPYESTCFIEIPFPDKQAFLKPGYHKSRFDAEFQSIFVPHLAERAIGSNGYFLIVDKKGVVRGPVFNHPEAIGKEVKTFVGATKEIPFNVAFGAPRSQAMDDTVPLNASFKIRLFGEFTRCLYFYSVGEYRVYACVPLRDVLIPMMMNIFIAGGALLVIALLFNAMMLRVDKMSREKEAHIKQELAFAQSIQAAELKEDAPETVNYKVSAVVHPARIVGGDFYDYYILEDGRIVIGIADVSGKGMPAAIFMMKAKTSLKLYSYRCDNIKDVMEVSNNEICQKNATQMFVTAWGGILDPVTGDLEYVCAGHNHPLIVRANGRVEWVPCAKNLALGICYNRAYQAQKLHLAHGDRLFLYTDGVTEAINGNRQLYGNQRLMDVLGRVEKRESLIDAVTQDLKLFGGGTEQADDITMVELWYK